MAKYTVTKIVDDLDGTEAADAETVVFGLDGKTYEIDLSADNNATLRTVLAVYIEKARPVTVTTIAPKNVTRVPSDAGTIRAWAKSQGIEVSARGRINESLRQQFADATKTN